MLAHVPDACYRNDIVTHFQSKSRRCLLPQPKEMNLNKEDVMEITKETFPNGNEALILRVPDGIDGPVIVAALQLPEPRPVLLVIGGGSKMTSPQSVRLRDLIGEGLVRTAAEEGAAIIDGGTQAGVMQIVGDGHSSTKSHSPLIGVCPASLVSWPQNRVGANLKQLDPNHTHFVLTPGHEWGCETETMLTLADTLGGDRPPGVVLVNGGPIAYHEVVSCVRRGWNVAVILGSGRLADSIGTALKKHLDPADESIAALIERTDLITVIDCQNGPDVLARTLRQMLFG